MTTTRIRACLTCAEPITITSRNPNRRYCTPRCRVADWHARNDRPRRSHHDVPNDVNDVPNDVPDAVPDRNEVPNGVRNGVGGPGNADPAQNTVTRCPHCRRPVTVLTWLLPPAAAHVTTPKVPDHG